MVNVQQNRDAHLPVDAHEVLHHLLGGDGIQRGHRLISQNDPRILRQSAGQRHALLLTAGQLIGPHVGLVQDTHLVQRLQRLDLVLPPEGPQQHPPEGHIRHAGGQHVLDNGGARHQIEGLEHHADAPAEPAQALARQGADIRAIHRQCAGGDLVHAVHGAQQRGLTGAGAADDGHELAVLNGQVHVIQTHRAVGIYLGYMVKNDHTVSSFPEIADGEGCTAEGLGCAALPASGKVLSWRPSAPE